MKFSVSEIFTFCCQSFQKNYTYAGEVLYVCWRSTYAGEVLYVYGWQILSDFTYAGEALYVCWRSTYAGEVLYVCWRFTYAGDFTYAGATGPPKTSPAGLIYPMAPMDQTWSEDSTIGVHNNNIKTDKISGRVWPPGAAEAPDPPPPGGLI